MRENTNPGDVASVPTRPEWLPEDLWPYPLNSMAVDGRRVIYTDTGGHGPVLLMVHVGLWSMVWGGLIAALHDGFRCVTLDVPGSGLSDRVPGSEQTLSRAAEAIGALIDELSPSPVILMVHDTGGLAALAAASTRPERIAGLVAVNTFVWPPRGILRLALRMFGSTAIRELNAFCGLLAWGSATRFGVGKHLTREHRRAWRRGLRDRSARRFTHRMFHDAARDRGVAEAAAAGLEKLVDRPVMTVFGRLGDYFRFQRRWRTLRPDATACVVPWGLHIPMSDDPALVAAHLQAWHAAHIARRL